MRSLINAMNSIVVSGRQDRTYVAGIGSLRGLDLLLGPCSSVGRAASAAVVTGLKPFKPVHQRSLRPEHGISTMSGMSCWHPERACMGSLAFACRS